MNLMCFMNWFVCSVFFMTKVSSTYLLQNLGWSGNVWIALISLFHEQVGHSWTYGWSHGCSLHLFIILTLEQEIHVLEAKPQQGNGVWDAHGFSVKEYCILFQFVINDINNGVHWHNCKQCLDIIWNDTLPFLKFDFLTSSTNPWCFWCCRCNGLHVVSESLQVILPPHMWLPPKMDTMGLKGMSFV